MKSIIEVEHGPDTTLNVAALTGYVTNFRILDQAAPLAVGRIDHGITENGYHSEDFIDLTGKGLPDGTLLYTQPQPALEPVACARCENLDTRFQDFESWPDKDKQLGIYWQLEYERVAAELFHANMEIIKISAQQPAVAVPQGVSDGVFVSRKFIEQLERQTYDTGFLHLAAQFKELLATPPEAKVGNRTRLVDDTETSIDRLAWDDGLPPSSEAKKR